MKQIVPFTKEIELKTNVDEITSISLDKSFRGLEKMNFVEVLTYILSIRKMILVLIRKNIAK